MIAQEYKSKVVKIVEEAPKVKTFHVKVPETFTFEPGQFVMLSLPEKKLPRAFSIASSPTQERIIELTIKIESYPQEEGARHLSPLLGKIKEGQEVTFKGPYGKFVLDESHDDLIFIAAGTGIAPLMSMIRYCLANNHQKNITLFNCNRTPKHIIYKKELEKIKNKITLIQTISRPEESSGWGGHEGRITKQLLEEYITNKNALVYICGPNAMVKQAQHDLEELEFPKEHVKVELWG